jgi:hypothetical protein
MQPTSKYLESIAQTKIMCINHMEDKRIESMLRGEGRPEKEAGKTKLAILGLEDINKEIKRRWRWDLKCTQDKKGKTTKTSTEMDATGT